MLKTQKWFSCKNCKYVNSTGYTLHSVSRTKNLKM